MTYTVNATQIWFYAFSKYFYIYWQIKNVLENVKNCFVFFNKKIHKLFKYFAIKFCRDGVVDGYPLIHIGIFPKNILLEFEIIHFLMIFKTNF